MDIVRGLKTQSGQAASAVDVDVPLDFTTGDATHTAQGSFGVPARTGSVLNTAARGYFMTTTLESSLTAGLGFPTLIDVSTAGDSFEYTAEWVEPPNAGTVLTRYYLYTGVKASWILVDGYPGAGPQALAFLDVPEFVSPPTFTSGHPIDNEMQWEIFDSDVLVMFMLLRDDEVIWRIDFGWDATTGTIPQPPSNVDTATYLGTELVEARLYVTAGEFIVGYPRRAAINQLHINPL